MPLLDVTSILDDPDFATTFDIIRYAENIDNHGRPVETDSDELGIGGVVIPSTTQDLLRLEEGEYIKGAITVYTSHRPLLSAGNAKDHTDADVIVWPAGGTRQYTVSNVDDWGEFGAGFVRAICTLRGINT